MDATYRFLALLTALILGLSACARNSKTKDSGGAPAPQKVESEVTTDFGTEPIEEPAETSATPGKSGEENWSPWWLLLPAAAVVKPAAESTVEEEEILEFTDKLCGKFASFDGVIKLVQSRTRGKRTYRLVKLDPKYKLDKYYCFRGAFHKTETGPAVFEILEWSPGFVNHVNAREAEGLPPLPRTVAKTCDEDLTG